MTPVHAYVPLPSVLQDVLQRVTNAAKRTVYFNVTAIPLPKLTYVMSNSLDTRRRRCSSSRASAWVRIGSRKTQVNTARYPELKAQNKLYSIARPMCIRPYSTSETKCKRLHKGSTACTTSSCRHKRRRSLLTAIYAACEPMRWAYSA